MTTMTTTQNEVPIFIALRCPHCGIALPGPLSMVKLQAVWVCSQCGKPSIVICTPRVPSYKELATIEKSGLLKVPNEK